MINTPGTNVTYPEDLKWEAVGPLDENGKGIFISPITRIVYSAARDDSGQPGTMVVVRDMASGEEHAVYRDNNHVWCTWAPNPNLICGRYSEEGQTEIFSIAADSGRTERLSSLPDSSRTCIPAAMDGHSIVSS
jgi:hypothetical protein